MLLTARWIIHCFRVSPTNEAGRNWHMNNNYSLLDNNNEFLANKFEANRYFRLCQERLAPHKNTVKKAIRYQAVNDEMYE